MISEKLEHEKISNLKGIFVTLGMVFGIAIVSIAVNFAAYVLKAPYLTYIAYAALIVAAMFLIKKRLQDYTYVIDKGKFCVFRSTGANEKHLLEVSLKKAVWLGKTTDIPQELKKTSLTRLTYMKKVDTYTIIYTVGDKCVGVFFSPTEQFVSMLREKIEKSKKHTGNVEKPDDVTSKEEEDYESTDNQERHGDDSGLDD